MLSIQTAPRVSAGCHIYDMGCSSIDNVFRLGLSLFLPFNIPIRDRCNQTGTKYRGRQATGDGGCLDGNNLLTYLWIYRKSLQGGPSGKFLMTGGESDRSNGARIHRAPAMNDILHSCAR